MYRAVLFDFDGTLADSYQAITASINHVRAHIGLGPLSEPEVRGHVGQGLEHLIDIVAPGIDLETARRLYREHHPGVLASGTFLLPGAAELLAELAARDLRLGICSNKPVVYTRLLLPCLGLENRFEVVLGPEDVANIKPAGDMIVRALELMKLPRADVLYVGDMAIDIETARNAGVTVWVVPTGSHARAVLEAARPDRLLQDLHEARRLLK